MNKNSGGSRNRSWRGMWSKPRGGVWGGCTLPTGMGMHRGLCPLPRIFFQILDLKMANFGALWVPVGDASSSSSPWIRHWTRTLRMSHRIAPMHRVIIKNYFLLCSRPAAQLTMRLHEMPPLPCSVCLVSVPLMSALFFFGSSFTLSIHYFDILKPPKSSGKWNACVWRKATWGSRILDDTNKALYSRHSTGCSARKHAMTV